MSTISNFVNTVIAIIKGDDAEVIGLKKRAVAVHSNCCKSMQNSFFRRNRRSC
jgi:hypothetical protein